CGLGGSGGKALPQHLHPARPDAGRERQPPRAGRAPLPWGKTAAPRGVIAALPGARVVPSVAGMKLIRAFGLVIGGVLAVYLVGRGIAEFFTINYSDPASYRLDWGGPSLAGVFAVHTGPAVLILAGTGVSLRRRWRRSYRLSAAT